MDKAKFTNEFFFYAVIVFLSSLSIWNFTVLVTTGSMLALMPLTILTVIIYLCVTRSKFCRIAIMFWSMIFLVVSSSLELVGRFMLDLADNFIAFDLLFYIKAIIWLAIGLLIYYYGKNTIVIEHVER